LPAAAGRPLRRGPERIADDFRLDDPTRAADVDPRLLASSSYDDEATRAAGMYYPPPSSGTGDRTLDDDLDFLSATHQGDGIDGAIDLGPREQSRRYPKLEDEDATKLGDLREMLAAERTRSARGAAAAGATSRRNKPETREPPRPPVPTMPPGPPGNDDATRAVDIGRNQSLSDVDWDLD
jgi:hypothetical protein